MLETFKAQLKVKAKALGANLSQKRIDAIADRLHKKFPDLTEVADHDTRIDDYNDLQPLVDISKADDHVRTLEAKAKGQPPKPDEPADPEKPTPAPDDTPAWAKALIDKVTKLETREVVQSLGTKLKEKLKDEKIPDSFLGKYKVEKEEDLDTVAEMVKTEFTVLKQDLANQGFAATSQPGGGPSTATAGNDKAVDADIAAWASKGKTAETK